MPGTVITWKPISEIKVDQIDHDVLVWACNRPHVATWHRGLWIDIDTRQPVAGVEFFAIITHPLSRQP